MRASVKREQAYRDHDVRQRQGVLRALTFVFALASVAFLIAVFQPGAAQAQSGGDATAIINRLNQIDNQIQTLSRAVYRGQKLTPEEMRAFSPQPAVSTEAFAQHEVRIGQLEAELRSLTGQIEQLGYEMTQLRQQVEKLDLAVASQSAAVSSPPVSDAAGEEAMVLDGVTGMPVPQGTGVVPPSDVAPDTATSAEALYDTAFGLVRAGAYAEAEGHFRRFLEGNPDHVLAGNAQYWLAETFYVRNDFHAAARLFAEGYQRYPKGGKAADNLLKLGMALARLDKKEDACLSFRQLEKDFPDERGPVYQRAQEEKKRIDCP